MTPEERSKALEGECSKCANKDLHPSLLPCMDCIKVLQKVHRLKEKVKK